MQDAFLVNRAVPAKLRGAGGNRSSKYGGLEIQSVPLEGPGSYVLVVEYSSRACARLVSWAGAASPDLAGGTEGQRVGCHAGRRPRVWIHLLKHDCCTKAVQF